MQTNTKVFYVGDYPISEYEWCNAFSQQLIGRNVRVVPSFCLRIIALIGDFLKVMHVKFPLITSRYKNMIDNNLTPMDKTFSLLGLPPYSLGDGVRKTLDWAKSQETIKN